MIDDTIIEAIVKIGNHPEVIKMCEPQVCFAFELQKWMIRRTLKAQELLQQEWNNELRKTKNINLELEEEGVGKC